MNEVTEMNSDGKQLYNELDSSNLPSQLVKTLEVLANLEDNWDYGTEFSERPNKAALKLASSILKLLQNKNILNHDVFIPYLAPGPDGQIEIQWPSLEVFCDIDVEENLVEIRWIENDSCLVSKTDSNLLSFKYDSYKFNQCDIESLVSILKQKLTKYGQHIKNE